MRHGSLFSGYGGLDMAVNAVFGSETVWVSDVDKGACKVLAHRFPAVPNIGDVTQVDWSDVPPVDIISGGSPCQDLSTAGRRAGMTEGTRSNLWVQMREAVNVIRPRYVVWENVRGAYSADAASDLGWSEGLLDRRTSDQLPKKEDRALRALGRVLGDLADLGYDAQWVGLRASDVGAPHQRYRVFLLAADTLGGIDLGGFPRADLGPLAGRDAGGAGAPADTGCLCGGQRVAAPGQGTGGRALCASGGRHGAPTAGANHAGLEGWPTDSERPDKRTTGQGSVAVQWGRYEPAIRRWEQVTGNPAPAPVDERNRLTAAFPEWMMGLCPGWITDVPGVTRTEALRMAGNGVVPQQAAAALQHLRSVQGEVIR